MAPVTNENSTAFALDELKALERTRIESEQAERDLAATRERAERKAEMRRVHEMQVLRDRRARALADQAQQQRATADAEARTRIAVAEARARAAERERLLHVEHDIHRRIKGTRHASPWGWITAALVIAIAGVATLGVYVTSDDAPGETSNSDALAWQVAELRRDNAEAADALRRAEEIVADLESRQGELADRPLPRVPAAAAHEDPEETSTAKPRRPRKPRRPVTTDSQPKSDPKSDHRIEISDSDDPLDGVLKH